MIDHGTHVSDVKIAYIGGGSRGWAWTFMTDLAVSKLCMGTVNSGTTLSQEQAHHPGAAANRSGRKSG